MRSTLIVHGSARVDGNTGAAVERLGRALEPTANPLHLCTFDIGPFRYEAGPEDDFPFLTDQLLRHEKIVFATPVYWYAMSGLMKMLFDRLTDLLLDPERRQLGRALAGKKVWLVATGTDDDLPMGFTEPFSRTCAYFAMDWQGAAYVRVDRAAPPSAQDLAAVDRLAASISDA